MAVGVGVLEARQIVAFSGGCDETAPAFRAGNPLLKVLVPAVLLLVILIVVNPFGKKSGSQQKAPEAVSDLSDEELAALGLGDTRVAQDVFLPENRRLRAQEMNEAMALFTQGFDGKMFNHAGTSWPESDVTIVDLGQFAREGYEAQMSIAYISLMNTVNNIAERDQYSGRPIVMVTDEGHIITKNPLVAPYAVKITKMWRKLGAWFWLATQNLADFPHAAETLLNMIEWWICLVMPQAEVEQIAKFK